MAKWKTYILAFLLLCVTGAQAADELSSSTQVYLITCTPGEDLYTRYGHTAIRIRDSVNDIDGIFNYGTFDFNTEHFYWKFMRGETWYELGLEYPFYWFERAYNDQNRQVYWQELNLHLSEKQALWDALWENYKPENKKYLYNFVFDNCATRPYQMILSACGNAIESDYTGYTGSSFRTILRRYTGSLSWANAGINLLFGPRADRKMNSEQRLFLPEELMNYIQQAHRTDTGEPFILNSNIASFEPVHTPWYASWPLGLTLYFLFVAGISYYDRRRRKWSWWVELVAGVPYVLLLLLVGFLTFFSCHPLVGFGWRLLIIPVTHLCARLIYIISWPSDCCSALRRWWPHRD